MSAITVEGLEEADLLVQRRVNIFYNLVDVPISPNRKFNASITPPHSGQLLSTISPILKHRNSHCATHPVVFKLSTSRHTIHTTTTTCTCCRRFVCLHVLFSFMVKKGKKWCLTSVTLIMLYCNFHMVFPRAVRRRTSKSLAQKLRSALFLFLRTMNFIFDGRFYHKL